VVIDVGSHFGYFALLAKELVGGPGKVFAIEPTNNSFGILDQNVKEHTNLLAFQIALSDLNGYIDFFEFSNLYSEYSSVDIDQFKSSEWFNENVVQKRRIEARLLDDFLADHQLNPGFIKIDVEGSENKVIAGGMNYFKHGSPLVSMEYLDQSRQNHSHKEAVEILRQLGYSTFIINNGGECEAVSDIDSYLSNRGLDSDNIILMKT